MMDDLIAFVVARLDEAETTVRRAGESHIAWLTYRRDDGSMGYTTVADGHAGVWIADGHELPEPASVLVMFDTARALRDVEAKRRLIEEFAARSTRDVAEIYLTTLAAAWSGHPDYRDEWKS
jgi:uncharacterized protein DUF6221